MMFPCYKWVWSDGRPRSEHLEPSEVPNHCNCISYTVFAWHTYYTDITTWSKVSLWKQQDCNKNKAIPIWVTSLHGLFISGNVSWRDGKWRPQTGEGNKPGSLLWWDDEKSTPTPNLCHLLSRSAAMKGKKATGNFWSLLAFRDLESPLSPASSHPSDSDPFLFA